MKLISFLSLNYAITFNIYFILTFPLTVLTSLYVLRQFNISTLPAIVGSLLFTFLPYHFFKGQGHFFLGAYYLVPLMIMVIVWVCMGDFCFYGRIVSRKVFTGIAICIAVGSEIPYYAFFSGFLLFVSGIFSTFRQISIKPLVITVMLSSVLFLTVVVNALPSLVYSYRYGENHVHERSPGESEFYGLKIVQLLLPVSGHRLASWARFKDAYNRHAPLVNENDSASLGAIGGLGFLVLIGWPLYAKRESWNAELFSSLSTLNIAAVLLATVGGFGSMFALLISPQFRSINRVSVYIAFLSIFAVVLLLEKLAQTKWVQSKSGRRLFCGLLGLILVIGLLDQTTRGFVPRYGQVKAVYQSDAAFINHVEASVPANAMVFQLPYMPFPESPVVGDVVSYDHFRAYLHSETLRWSFGAMRNRDGDVWQRHVTVKPLHALVEAVAAAGFSGIYLDRYGYADRGAELEAQLAKLLETAPVVSPDQRLTFFNFNQYRAKQARGLSMGETQGMSSDLMVVGDWTPLPERKGKSSGLAAAVFDGELNVLVRGSDRQIYHTQMAAGGWTSWTSLGGAARYGPAAVEFMGDLWVFMGGIGKGIYANRLSNRTWSGWSEIPGRVRTASEPAAVAFEHALYLFQQSANERINVNRFDGAQWSGWGEVPGGGLTSSAPTAAIFDRALYLFHRGRNNHIYVNRFDGAQWSGWSGVPGGGLTSSAPTAATFDTTLYLFIREMNNRIYVNRFDGMVWTGWRLVSTDGPAAIKPGVAASPKSLSLIVQTMDKRISLGQLPVAPHLPND